MKGEQGGRRRTETQRRNKRGRERRRSNMAGNDVPCRRKRTRFNVSERAVRTSRVGTKGGGGEDADERLRNAAHTHTHTPNCVDLRKYSRSFRLCLPVRNVDVSERIIAEERYSGRIVKTMTTCRRRCRRRLRRRWSHTRGVTHSFSSLRG